LEREVNPKSNTNDCTHHAAKAGVLLSSS